MPTSYGSKNTDDATRRIVRNVIGHEDSLLSNIAGAKGKLPFNEFQQLNKAIP